MICEKLRDEKFQATLIRFMQQFNANVDWDVVIKNWIIKNKTDEQISNDIHSLTWIDKDIEADDKLFPSYIHITSSLYFHLNELFQKQQKLLILDYDPILASARGEQLMEIYKDALIDILTARLISFEFTNTVTDGIYDFGFFYTTNENIEKLKSCKCIHFDFLGLDSYDFIDELRLIYSFVD